MDGVEWLDGATPGNGSLRPGSCPNHTNHLDYPSYSIYPNCAEYSGNGKTTARSGETNC